MQGTVVMQRNDGIAKRLGWLIFALLGVVWISGCSQLRIPRIDPTGQRLFLPAPAYTTIEPGLPFRGSFRFSEPAYRTPPNPPPCPPGMLAGTPSTATAPAIETTPVSLSNMPPLRTAYRPEVPPAGSHPNATRLVIAPHGVVALVGKPKLLKASLYSPDGTRLAGQPVEWILSQESVGHFVAVSEEGRFDGRRPRPNTPRKLSNDYALGRTASSARLSAGRNPGVGEAWLSLISAREGISRVTVYAKGAAAENVATQTATVHWVDAKWAFPATVTGHPGEPVELSTTVLRASNKTPAAGMIIRYEIVSGPAASFAPAGQRVVEVPADLQGVARVQIVPRHREPGETQVAVQVIQPPSNHSDYSPIVLGQGTTSVRWSMPALALRVTGPDRFDVDSTMTVHVDVTNSGDLTAKNVVVSDVIPDGVSFLNSDPPAQVFGDRVQWALGPLAPGTSRFIEFNCRADRAGDYQHHLQARSSDGASAEEHVAARVTPNALELHVNGPEAARVGDQVQFRIIARNVGNQPLTNVVVRDVFDRGFEHMEAVSPIVRELGDLEPGGEIPFAVTMSVTQPGTICHQLELKSDEGYATAKRVCLNAVGSPQPGQSAEANRPALLVTKTGPEVLQVDQEGEFVVRIENNGNVPLTGLRVVDQFPACLRAVQATDGFQQRQGALIWSIERLEPGQFTIRTVRYRSTSSEQSAGTQVTVTSAEPSLTVIDEAYLEIYDLGDVVKDLEDDVTPLRLDTNGPTDDILARQEFTQPELSPPDSNAFAAGGDLRLTVTDLNDPIRQGRRMIYLVHVVNERNTNDQNVRLRLEFPPNLNLENANLPLTRLESAAGNRIFSTEPVAELRPGDEIVLRLEVTAAQSGRAKVRVSLESSRTRSPIVIEEVTTVFAE